MGMEGLLDGMSGRGALGGGLWLGFCEACRVFVESLCGLDRYDDCADEDPASMVDQDFSRLI